MALKMELRGKSFCLYPMKSINLDSRTIVESKPVSKSSMSNSQVCSRLYSPRKVIKSPDSYRGELHPAKTLLPSRGLIKLTALPEELKDPLNVYPATQYLLQNNHEKYHRMKDEKDEWKRKAISLNVSPQNDWKKSDTWIPNQSYSVQRQMTTNNLLIEADNIISKSSPSSINRLFEKKLLIVGDSECGKRDLVASFRLCQAEEDYVQPVLDNPCVSINVDVKAVNMQLWNTSGQEDYDKLRPLSYSGTDVVLLCFSIDSPGSFQNIHEKWAPEIKHLCKKVPFIIVGNKKDLRSVDNPNNRKLLPFEEGIDIAERIGAFMYMECSSITKEGIKDVLKTATKAALKSENRFNNCICL